MTERHGGFLVTLDTILREDDADEVLRAIEMIKGVSDVRPVPAGSLAEANTKTRRDLEWQHRLGKVIREMAEGESPS